MNDLTKRMEGVNITDDEVEEEGEEKEEEEEDVSDLPEYACSYCGIHDPACVVMCTTTKKWFCNGHASSSGSHIIHHLVRSRNRQVSLHSTNPLGNSVLECRVCGCQNVFVLGYMDDGGNENSPPNLICRYPCVNRNARKWNLDNWTPIIQDLQFVPRIVKAPSLADERDSKLITVMDMVRLGELWLRDPQATSEDFESPNYYDDDNVVEPVKLV